MHPNYREIPSPLQGLWDALDDHVATTPSYGRMALRATAFVGVTLFLVGPYLLASLFGARTKRPIAKLWYRICAATCGLRIHVMGRPSDAAATLLVANHISYLDIIALGSQTDARFIAKAEVADWPVFGFLARIADTVFVTRDRKQAGRDSAMLGDLIKDGERLILFPEGTSSNGRTVLPFRSAMFAAVDPRRAAPRTTLQPVSIAYADPTNGRPLRGALGDCYAWYGDMTLFGHLMTVFGLKGACVTVTFHAPMHVARFHDRKSLARTAEHTVRRGVQLAQR